MARKGFALRFRTVLVNRRSPVGVARAEHVNLGTGDPFRQLALQHHDQRGSRMRMSPGLGARPPVIQVHMDANARAGSESSAEG